MIQKLLEELFKPHDEETISKRQEELMPVLDRFFDAIARAGGISDARTRSIQQSHILSEYEFKYEDVNWEEVMDAFYGEQTDSFHADLVARYRKWRDKRDTEPDLRTVQTYFR